MKQQYLILLLSFIIGYDFCYGDEPPSWEPFKTISENKEYFCWIVVNDNTLNSDNDTLLYYGHELDWVMKVYNKDSILVWQKKGRPSGYSEGLLSNDGKKFIYIEYWYYHNGIAVRITTEDKNDLCIKFSDFNIPEKSLSKTVSHWTWLNNYRLRDNDLMIYATGGKSWIIDIDTGLLKEPKEKSDTNFILILLSVVVVIIVIITILHLRKQLPAARPEYRADLRASLGKRENKNEL